MRKRGGPFSAMHLPSPAVPHRGGAHGTVQRPSGATQGGPFWRSAGPHRHYLGRVPPAPRRDPFPSDISYASRASHASRAHCVCACMPWLCISARVRMGGPPFCGAMAASGPCQQLEHMQPAAPGSPPPGLCASSHGTALWA